MRTRAVRAAAAWMSLVVLGGCASSGTEGGGAPPGPEPTGTPPSGTQPSVIQPSVNQPSVTQPRTPSPGVRAECQPLPARGLVYYVGHRARTGEPLLYAEQTALRGRADLLTAVRAATAVAAIDPDYASPWGGDVVDGVRLRWDGDEGYYSVRLRDEAATRRPPGMSMREAHLAIQQVVWTLGSVGRVPAPVRFSVARSDEPVTDLLGVPATGASDTYLAADYRGVLSSMNILAPSDGAAVDGVVEVSGVAESFEATVGIRATSSTGEIVHDYSTTAEQRCGRLWPWRYSLDTSGWAPGVYTVSALTDDPVGIAHGSDGPQIDTKTIMVH